MSERHVPNHLSPHKGLSGEGEDCIGYISASGSSRLMALTTALALVALAAAPSLAAARLERLRDLAPEPVRLANYARAYWAKRGHTVCSPVRVAIDATPQHGRAASASLSTCTLYVNPPVWLRQAPRLAGRCFLYVHEFGHLAGLGHASPTSDPFYDPTAAPWPVMAGDAWHVPAGCRRLR